jgi:phage repressor protein C with HTH and peptisase S24 domain
MAETLGETVRGRRRQMGWTLAQLAGAVDCSKAYLSAIENGKLDNPPSRPLLGRLERALEITPGELIRQADWQRTPGRVRAEVEAMARRSRRLAAKLKQSLDQGAHGGRDLDALYRSGELQQWIAEQSADIERLQAVRYQVPLINRVAAGYPTEFTDLDYPARVADEYLAAPGLSDPSAFAARVVGASMEPDYAEGDIIVFSPERTPACGDDCFVRLEPDHHTTFKRVFFDDERTVRLQPLNPAYPAQVLARERVSGIWPAVMRIQPIGRHGGSG